MRDLYGIINTIIKDELDNEHRIVIFPIGRVGLEAKYILENRFGQKGIYVDNELFKYNNEVSELYSIKNLDENFTVIICCMDYQLNIELTNAVKKINKRINIRTCLEHSRVFFPEREEYFKKIKNACRVKKSAKFDLVRVGAINDGGYVMLDDFQEDYRAYSFGIGNEISWDDWVSDKGIQVFCYDHTIDKLPHKNVGLHFSKIGISDTDKPDENLLSMESILEKNGDLNNNNLILKMDVEGAEWDFINSVDEKILSRFRQMTFELHWLTETCDFEKKYKALLKLKRNHSPVWVHANNAHGLAVAVETEIPPLLEITFVRNDTYKLQDVHYNAPIDIDTPNIKDISEVELKNWGGADA